MGAAHSIYYQLLVVVKAINPNKTFNEISVPFDDYFHVIQGCI